MAKDSGASQREADHNVDRFPTASQACSRVANALRDEQGQVEQIEIRCGANGEVTYRWHPAREELTEVGYIAPE